MTLEKEPIFIVGSGRSGTRMIYKLLSGIPHIEIHHEYLCTHIQQLAALYHMHVISQQTVKEKLLELYGAAIYYSRAKHWIDSSNKLSWVIEPLFELFPSAKFVNITRDGRKVASSYFHKLSDEMYDDESVRVMQEWLKHQDRVPMPPPEKRYWWNIPRGDDPFADEFPLFDQFERACYQWVEANRVILETFEKIPKEQKLWVKLENLVKDKSVLEEFLAFFGVNYEEHYYEFLQTPQNVIFPIDFRLTGNQAKQFDRIASVMMAKLGYAGIEEYSVDYGRKPG